MSAQLLVEPQASDALVGRSCRRQESRTAKHRRRRQIAARTIEAQTKIAVRSRAVAFRYLNGPSVLPIR